MIRANKVFAGGAVWWLWNHLILLCDLIEEISHSTTVSWVTTSVKDRCILRLMTNGKIYFAGSETETFKHSKNNA
jgi:hypothetical protein